MACPGVIRARLTCKHAKHEAVDGDALPATGCLYWAQPLMPSCSGRAMLGPRTAHTCCPALLAGSLDEHRHIAMHATCRLPISSCGSLLVLAWLQAHSTGCACCDCSHAALALHLPFVMPGPPAPPLRSLFHACEGQVAFSADPRCTAAGVLPAALQPVAL